MDESGHDHRQMPYEVRGGVAIHAGEVWPFVQAVQNLEIRAFGVSLSHFKKEFKGEKLLDKDRFKWAKQDDRLEDEERRKYAKSFLNKGLERKPPTHKEFTAYGQASLEMVRGIFGLLRSHNAALFASAIPRGAKPPSSDEKADEFLRKDHVFLLERYFYFLEGKREHGLLVMDEVEDMYDRRFVRRLESYFTKTQKGAYRTSWIVPSPIFVSSAMSLPIQVADVCIYCVNWGFRLPVFGMDAPIRNEIGEEFGPWLNELQFKGQGYHGGEVFPTFGIVYVPDPYTAR